MQPNACISSSFCSIWWLLAEPVAGLGDAAAIDARERQPVEQLAAEAGQQEPPGAHVLRLFLHPVDRRAVGYGASAALQLVHRQRIELLDAARSPRPGASSSSRSLGQLVIDLAASRAARARRSGRSGSTSGITVWKLPVAQFVERRDRLRMPQQALGGHHHQRLAPRPQHLPPQAVEVLRRRGRVDDLNVVVRPPASGTAPAGRLECSGPALRSRAAAAAPARSAAATCLRRWR